MSFENQNKNVMPAGNFAGTSGSVSNNMSGRGAAYPVPDIVANRFNWGAFTFTWIWGLFNRTYITLLIFAVMIVSWIPIIGWLISLGVCIWFGIKGNEWAWQNKQFTSIQAFHEYQKKWGIAAAILYGALIPLAVIGIIAAMTLPALMTNTEEQQNYIAKLKAANTIEEIIMMNKAMEEKCELSSIGLAKCFEKQMSGERQNNTIYAKDGSVWTFNGNRRCKKFGDCKVTIKVKQSEQGDIPLYVDSKGFIEVKEDDVNEYINNIPLAR